MTWQEIVMLVTNSITALGTMVLVAQLFHIRRKIKTINNPQWRVYERQVKEKDRTDTLGCIDCWGSNEIIGGIEDFHRSHAYSVVKYEPNGHGKDCRKIQGTACTCNTIYFFWCSGKSSTNCWSEVPGTNDRAYDLDGRVGDA